MKKLIMASKLVLIPQLITRLADAMDCGDNYLIILKKQ